MLPTHVFIQLVPFREWERERGSWMCDELNWVNGGGDEGERVKQNKWIKYKWNWVENWMAYVYCLCVQECSSYFWIFLRKISFFHFLSLLKFQFHSFFIHLYTRLSISTSIKITQNNDDDYSVTIEILLHSLFVTNTHIKKSKFFYSFLTHSIYLLYTTALNCNKSMEDKSHTFIYIISRLSSLSVYFTNWFLPSSYSLRCVCLLNHKFLSHWLSSEFPFNSQRCDELLYIDNTLQNTCKIRTENCF